jgi:hypothetical protein
VAKFFRQRLEKGHQLQPLFREEIKKGVLDVDRPPLRR